MDIHHSKIAEANFQQESKQFSESILCFYQFMGRRIALLEKLVQKREVYNEVFEEFQSRHLQSTI